MKFTRRRNSQLAVLDITALIDIMFILNIFFMLNAQSAPPRVLEVHLPKASSSMVLQSTSLAIQINDLDQLQLNGQALTLAQLKEKLLPTPKNTAISIVADRESSYGRAIEVFNLLRELKFDKVNLETLPAP